MFPKFKNRMKINEDKWQYFTYTLHTLFSNDLPERKKLVERIGICDRTIRNWLHNQTKPSSYDLILLMQYSNPIFDTVLELVLGKKAADEIICYMQLKNIQW